MPKGASATVRRHHLACFFVIFDEHTVEDVTFQAANLADVIDLVKGNGHDDRFSTNLRSWVPYGGTANKLFKQWKSRVCLALIGVLSLQASVKFRLVCCILSGVFRFFVASFCLCEVFAKSLPKSLWSLAALRSVSGSSAEFT